ncbi:MAG: tRNA (N(6)-L-threonylcarbamoyladenosine(37)-C(2))-methylthiotransferase MtaB [Erysipelotrichaceae bacterium]|nr:tRNA (N(6)-L-threonylcarbamoyladenosine(37)-C(2))-methylthiotransferase MtaB [Erysipelotrichaceae bacterium]
MSTFAVVTLGCKVNSYESEWYCEQLKERGLTEVSYKEEADVYIINTCAVTNVASSKSRQKINVLRKNHPQAILCVVGCYIQTSLKEQVFEGIDLVIATAGKKQLPDLVMKELEKRDRIVVYEDTREYMMDEMPLQNYHQTRAFLKVQDGCNQFCSYCIIPFARGKERSLPLEDVMETAKRLVQSGHKELVLTGIHTGRYFDGEHHLIDLMRALMTIEGLKRLRISSIEITEVTDEMIQLMKEEPRIARHLHVPIQSATNEILKKMNRPYTVEQFHQRLQEIRNELPQISISTDVIVGFPGETDELFEMTARNLAMLEFSFLHVFPFSSKKGTVADQMNDKVASQTKKKRVKCLTELSSRLYNKYKQSMLHQVKEVYVEIFKNGVLEGHTSEYLPCCIKSEKDARNEMIPVSLTHLDDGQLWGIWLKKGE